MQEATKAMLRRSTDDAYKNFFLGKGIDIGCGNDCVASCVGYDRAQGDAEYCQNIPDQSFDFLHSSHCLEHLQNPSRGLRNWIRIVNTGGYLIITVPDEHMYEKNIWPSLFNSDHKWSFRLGGSNPRSTSIEVDEFFAGFKDIEIISITRITDNYFETCEDLTARTDISVECCIEIILKKIRHIEVPVALNSFCFLLNSYALGDVLAAIPSIKYMIDTYYDKDPDRYKVIAQKSFRPLFDFIPDSSFHNLEDRSNDWDIPSTWAIGLLNHKSQEGITRTTPKSMHLAQYASIKLTDRILNLAYCKLPTVSVSHFNIDFSKTIVIVATYRDTTRMWPAEDILMLAAWIKTQGLTPVFIGKTDTEIVSKTSLPENLGSLGLDLRNKTTILELATIMSKTKAVVGLDSGPIHLAGTTDTPIVCGYTTVKPEYRIPIRDVGKTWSIIPDIDCQFCESTWMSHFHNYENCYLGQAKCCRQMTAVKFIAVLKELLHAD